MSREIWYRIWNSKLDPPRYELGVWEVDENFELSSNIVSIFIPLSVVIRSPSTTIFVLKFFVSYVDNFPEFPFQIDWWLQNFYLHFHLYLSHSTSSEKSKISSKANAWHGSKSFYHRKFLSLNWFLKQTSILKETFLC